MTEREEFEKWYREEITLRDMYCLFKAWQARGELDDVLIKELEEELKDADGAAQILANQKVELTAKLDKAKEALKCIDEDLVNPVHYILVKEALEELDK